MHRVPNGPISFRKEVDKTVTLLARGRLDLSNYNNNSLFQMNTSQSYVCDC